MHHTIEKLLSSLRIKNRQAGYTLIQMAIAMLVLGILMAAFLNVYTLYSNAQKATTTQENVASAVQKLQTYRQSFGTYPCPSPMNVARESPAPVYGRASDYAQYRPSGTTPLSIGQCADGICIEGNVRSDLVATPTIRVRVGALPFRDMQMDENETYDGYGSRLWYAVTEDMCNLSTFNDTMGGINIVNDLGESQTSPPKSGAFIVISPGINKVGAYSKYGVQGSPCTATADAENCRDMSLSSQPDTSATYIIRSTVDAITTPGNIYDDITEYFSASANQLWRRMTPTSEDILDIGGNKVAIGPSTPNAELDISQSAVNPSNGLMTVKSFIAPLPAPPYENGGLRVNGGSLWATQYCSETGSNCFKPEDITGDQTAHTGGVKCPANTYPVGITSDGVNAKFDCMPDIAIQCPVGQALKGFSVSGTTLVPICTAAAFYKKCPITKMSLCSPDDITLPEAAHGSFIYRSAGECKGAYYSCSNGVWSYYLGWGECKGTETTTTGISCGECWSGTFTQTYNSCKGTANTRATDCKCAACSQYSTGSCPPAKPDGTPPTTRYDFACDPSDPYKIATLTAPFSGTISSPGSCSCSKISYNQFDACPGGQIRKTSPAAVVPQTDSSKNAWPADMRLGKYTAITIDSSSCSYVAGSSVNECVCDTSDKYTSTLHTPIPSCKQAKAGSRVVNGTSYPWSDDVLKSTNIDAVACTFTAPAVENAAQFEPVKLFWREVSGSLSGNNKSRDTNYPLIDDACSCESDGQAAIKGCQRANTSGTYDNYQCSCNP